MTDRDRLEQLVSLARKEQPPAVDVSGRVMNRLRVGRAGAALRRPFVLVASIGLAIAIPLMLAVPYALQSWGDPLVWLFVQGAGGLP